MLSLKSISGNSSVGATGFPKVGRLSPTNWEIVFRVPCSVRDVTCVRSCAREICLWRRGLGSVSPCCSCSCRRSCAPLPYWCPAGCFFTCWSLFQAPMSILFSCFFMFDFLFPLPCAFESRPRLRTSLSQPRCLAHLVGIESDIILWSNQLPHPKSIASQRCCPLEDDSPDLLGLPP